ncbi:MAG: hypothetical protein DRG63_05640 [Deltaproteobacteria bacterium]|nr:MAG: hypothetical protein DRG63_05640 [Deltaproteobacteria bacterium]
MGMTVSYPIILAHGIWPFHRVLPFLFDSDNQEKDDRHYFRKIRSLYIQNSIEAFHSRTSWGGELERRAADLRKEILKFTNNFKKYPKVHIIAHSMGGLDARWMIYKYQMAEKVASLTTIGTPHHGSSYADKALRRFGWLISAALKLGLDLRGALALTRAACRDRNELLRPYEEKNGVLYRTIAGTQSIEHIFAPLKRSYRIIWKEEGENDGLVSLESALWKREYFLKQIDADHLNQIGWWDGGHAMGTTDKRVFDENIQEFYLGLAMSLPN